jgi:hypothetical protein
MSYGDVKKEGASVPDSFGKRNREKVKAKKAEARDDRRIARNQRRKGIFPLTEHDRTEMPDEATGDADPGLAADA